MAQKSRTDLLTPAEDSDLESPSIDQSDCFAIDQAIRKRGYAIKSRDKDQEPVWERNGVLFTQTDVLQREGIIDTSRMVRLCREPS